MVLGTLHRYANCVLTYVQCTVSGGGTIRHARQGHGQGHGHGMQELVRFGWESSECQPGAVWSVCSVQLGSFVRNLRTSCKAAKREEEVAFLFPSNASATSLDHPHHHHTPSSPVPPCPLSHCNRIPLLPLLVFSSLHTPAAQATCASPVRNNPAALGGPPLGAPPPST